MNYDDQLQRIPAPGGNGCHPHLMRLANLGVCRGLTPEQVFQDIKAAIPQGGRRVPDREILVTIEKAFREKNSGETRRRATWKPHNPVRRPQLDADGLRAKIMAEGSPEEVDLWEVSPVRLDGEPEADAAMLLRHFYEPNEFLFIGDVYDKQFMTVAEWLERIEQNGTAGLPHIIPNPLTGQEHEKSTGTMSRRCDAAVAHFRFAMAEFDNMPREDQLQFWSGIINRNLLPVAAIIDSGGKSLHAWIYAGVTDRSGWDRNIKQRLFERWLIPMGADPATKNPARLSRLPGHKRAKTGRWQRLLWLQQNGQPSS